MNSMTGYGRGDATVGGVSVTVELRSVNNRFRDIQLRSPVEYGALEPRITTLLKRAFHRGRISAFVRRATTESQTEVRVDLPLARRYHAALRELAGQLDGVDGAVPLSLLAELPGVMVSVQNEVDAASEWTVVETALEAAIAHMSEMRSTEGAALHADLSGHLNALSDLRQKVALEADGVAARLRLKLLDRISRLTADRVDPGRLAQEAAILADKADISEELARLASHVQQFRGAMDSDGAIGQQLNFLTQEMNREINTIGSKSAEHVVSALVVEMKSTLERIREQVANVE